MIQSASPILNRSQQEEYFLNYNKDNPSIINTLISKIVTEAIKAKHYISVNYDHPNQSIQEYLKKILKSNQGLQNSAWKSPRWRIQYKEIEALIISTICQANISSKEYKVIEIGAGKLENGLSYLMARMPTHLRKNVVPTDLDNGFIKKTCLKQLDLCRISKTYSSSSLDKIIGSSILDSISDSELTVACKQMYSALKPGGLLIHFANLRPNTDTLLTSHREAPYICFPWRDENNLKGLMRIEKEKLLNFISKNEEISNFAVSFLRWYSDLTVSERELTLNTIIMDPMKPCIEFSNWIRAINPEGLEEIDNYVFFEKRIKTALEATGFSIKEFGLKSKSLIRDRNSNDATEFNYFSCKFGILSASTIYVLFPNKVCYTAKMHVIVAEKVKT